MNHNAKLVYWVEKRDFLTHEAEWYTYTRTPQCRAVGNEVSRAKESE